MTAPLTDQQLADAAEAVTTYKQHPDLGFACCSAHPAAEVAAPLLAEVTRLRAELADQRAATEQRLGDIARAVRYLDAGDHGSARSVLVTAGGGTDRLATAPICHCGHSEAQHQGTDGLGGAQCRVCPGDSERSWRHAYEAAPADPCRAEPVHQAGCPAAT